MNKTKIEWCDVTWNPVIGCSRVSEGCQNCYAEVMAGRLEAIGKLEYAGLMQTYACSHGRGSFWYDVRCLPDRLPQPLRLRKPSRIFAHSMSDPFHEKVPFEFLDKEFAVMALAERHTFMLLTKRIERALEYLTHDCRINYILGALCEDRLAPYGGILCNPTLPLPNVWLGVTAENQARADERIPFLLQTPAALRFVSCEPMLEMTDLSVYLGQEWSDLGMWLPNREWVLAGSPQLLNWVICGGETGPHARPFELDWARSLRDQCESARVPFFMKQGGKIKYENLPADLQVRQWPKSKGE
jgi:protein gp37